jgi:AAA family ATP:ADP antiporter
LFQLLKSIAPSERRSVGLLFFYGFGSAAAYVIARTVADSAFLSHIGTERLPEVYMLSAGVVALSSLVYARIVRKTGLRRVVLLTLLGLAVNSAVMPLVMLRFSSSLTVFAAAYLLAQIRGSLGTIQYATLLNEQFAHRNPERVVGLIGVGATLAGIVFGLGIGLVSQFINVEMLMYLVALMDLLTMVPVMLLQIPHNIQADKTSLNPIRTRSADSTNELGLRDAIKSRYVLGIAGMVALCVAAATLIEFQWKVTAASELHRDEEELAQYFGYFYGSVYLVTGLLQIFVTGRLFRRRGVLIGLLAFPSALFAATLAAWFATTHRAMLMTVTLTKGCDTLKRSMTDPATQVLYGPLSREIRRQAITLVAGIAKPLAEAAAAVTLVLATPSVTTRQLSLIVLVVLMFWLVINLGVFRRFIELRSSVEKHKTP